MRKLTFYLYFCKQTEKINKLLNFRMRFKYGLKAQKLLAQGIALGIMAISKAPCKGKSFKNSIIKLLPLQGDFFKTNNPQGVALG